jgi:hypothetical protein
MKTEDENIRNQFFQLELEHYMKKHRIKDVNILLSMTPEELMKETDLAIQVIAYIQKMKKELK